MSEPDRLRDDRRILAYTAAAMYGATALDGLIEMVLPNVPGYSALPIFVVVGVFVLLMTVGPRMPRRVLAGFGPLGVALVSYALATTDVTASDAAVLYALPVLWQSLFFGRRGAGTILGLVAVGDALALVALGPYGYAERWFDVMVAVSAISVVVCALQERNARLVSSLARESREDPLTGLLNRRGFEDRAAVAMSHIRRAPAPIAIVAIDIDHFKRVNDDWGHVVGDRVLRHIGEVLIAQAREIDVLARFGGEEFTILLPGTDTAGAVAFATRVRDALARPHGALPTVRISAGVAVGGGDSAIGVLVRDADAALYAAKRAGRNRTCVHGCSDAGAPPSAGRAPLAHEHLLIG